jgi:GAF domain-containing protein
MPVNQRALAATLQTLLSGMDLPDQASDEALIERLDRVIVAAQDVLEVDGVGLMLLDEKDTLRVVGSSDPTAEALERGQQRLKLGPALDCVHRDDTIVVTDLADQPDYAALWHYLQEDAAAPVRAVLSVPVGVAGRTVGTLNAFRCEPHLWTPEQAQAVTAYAGILGVLLRLGARRPDGRIRMPGPTGR